MKYTYLSTNDLGESIVEKEGKLEISLNYQTKAESDAKYQPSGSYALDEELTTLSSTVDNLGEVYQIKGEYIDLEFADERFAIKDEVVVIETLMDYVKKEDLEGEYATKAYVDEAILGIESGGGTGEPGSGFDGTYDGPTTFKGNMNIEGDLYLTNTIRALSITDSISNKVISIDKIAMLSDIAAPGAGGDAFDGNYEGDSAFDGDMEISGELTVSSIYDAENSRQILVSDISLKSDGGVSGDAYTLPKASNVVLGGIKIGNNLDVDSEGKVSISNDLSGNIKINGNLEVVGDITYTGQMEKIEAPLKYRGNSLKVLFEHGKMIKGTPLVSGEVVYQEDGTFSDGAKYSGKITPEGYLDLSIKNSVTTTLATSGLIGKKCFAFVEIIGKLTSANSIFAPMVRSDLTTTNSFIGTRNPTASNTIGQTIMKDGLNRLVFETIVGGETGQCVLYINGTKYTETTLSTAYPAASEDAEMTIAYSWAAGGKGLLKKCAILDCEEFAPTEADYLAISTNGFEDSAIPVLGSFIAEQRIRNLENSLSSIWKNLEFPGKA